MQPENPWRRPQNPVTPRSRPTSLPSQRPFFTPEQPKPVQIPQDLAPKKMAPVPSETPEVVVPKAVKIALLVVAIPFILFLGLFIATSAPVRNAKNTSDTFVSSVQSKNTDAAYKLTSELFQKSSTKQDLDTVIVTISPQLKGKRSTTDEAIYKKSSIVPETAVFTYKFKTADNTEYAKTELQKNKAGDWKIINFRADTSPLKTNIE